jgi:hypothetical protein
MPFLGARGQSSRGYFGGGTTPGAPTLGTLTTSISSPNTVSKPTMSQNATDASFSWSNPGAGGIAIQIPFTAPTFNGGLTITDYQYSTDNGSSWKSAGSTTSPISITTVSGSSANLAAATEYTIRLRAVNPLGSGTASSSSVRNTLVAVTSYTVRLYNNRGTEVLHSTTTGNTTGTFSASHNQTAADWSITVAAVNSNGTGSYSVESDAATGWTLSSCTNTDASACAGCGTKSTVCSQWTRSSTLPGGGTTGPCNVSCGAQSGCSGGWNAAVGDFSTGGVDYIYVGPAGYFNVNGISSPVPGCGSCPEGCFRFGSYYIESCSLGGVRGHLTPYSCSACETIFGGLC